MCPSVDVIIVYGSFFLFKFEQTESREVKQLNQGQASRKGHTEVWSEAPWFQICESNYYETRRSTEVVDWMLKLSNGTWKSNAVNLVQFSRSVVSDSLRPHESQHSSPPCPSPTPGVYPNPCPLSWWCHPTISSSVVPFSSCLKSFQVSGSFQMSKFFTSGGQSIGVSASTSVLPMNTQDWFPLGYTGWNSL